MSSGRRQTHRSGHPPKGRVRADNGRIALAQARDGTNYTAEDTDGDGLCDGGRAEACRNPDGTETNAPGEVIDYGSSPTHADSDEDGIEDGNESALLDPLRSGTVRDVDADGYNALVDSDSDNDRLNDGDEHATHNTSIEDADSDNDNLTDFDEVIDLVAWGMNLDPNDSDTDNDTLLDGDEVLTYQTDPNAADTDGDGLSDGEEVKIHSTSPHAVDTDRDRMPDAWEVRYQLNPLVDDSQRDEDRDSIVLGLTNYQEYLIGTNPRDTDSELGVFAPITGQEGDGINDYLEYLLGLDPTKDDAAIDTDSDGLLNLAETVIGTDPYLTDSDGDSLDDGWEAGTNDSTALQLGLYRTDPRLFDTDEDGLDDGRELARWNGLGVAAWSTDYDQDSPDHGTGLLPALAHNLRDADSDGDGFDDGQEFLVFFTNASLPDTDGDGDGDREEVMVFATNPLDETSNRTSVGNPPPGDDTDGDGLTDLAEAQYGTDPADPDSDDDILPDGRELMAWGLTGWGTNHDGDAIGNNLRDPDSDNDGLGDGVEFASGGLRRDRFYITSPRLSDTDGDGLSDSREDTNGLGGEAAARARATPMPAVPQPDGTQWWIGINDLGPYVDGSFGVRLYAIGHAPLSNSTSVPANAPEDGESAGRGTGGQPYPDYTDTDKDKLTDGQEVDVYFTPWDDPDVDLDQLSDYIEALQQTNARSNDTDNDGLDDNEEARLVRGAGASRNSPQGDMSATSSWASGLTSPIDGDDDEDGLLDSSELGLGLQSTDPLNADTDHDGLPDGFESGLQEPQRDALGVSWTSPVALPCGRGQSFRPAPVGGLLPGQSARDGDSDDDGLPDGFEDANGNGLLDAGELNWTDPDADGDDIPDGLELRIWGVKDICDLVAAVGNDFLVASQFDPSKPLATDPRDNTTDTDAVLDGMDLNPRGLPLVGLDFGGYEQLREIDPWTPGACTSYSPELEIRITVDTAAGRGTLQTPALPSLCIDKREVGPLASVLDGEEPGKEGNLRVPTPLVFAAGLIMMPVPDDVSLFKASATPDGESVNVNEVVITIHMVDDDHFENEASDVIDLSAKKDSTMTDLVLRFDLGTRQLRFESSEQLADGEADGRRYLGDDDARLSVKFIDEIPFEFVGRALGHVPGHGIPLPAGTSLGDK